jgi:hypothetical protein
MEIELFNNLDINDKNDFSYHINYINQDLVTSVIKCYLTKIVGKNFEQNFMSIKNFQNLLTIYHYPKEFILSNIEDTNIQNYIKQFYHININPGIDIKLHYENKIKPLNSYIKKTIENIINNNRETICNDYCKIYYNLDNLENDIEDETEKQNIKKYKTQYYNLLKSILKDKTDMFLKDKCKSMSEINEYEKFRKKMFMDRLQKDLETNPPIFDGIIYLLEIIRKKLCNIAPQNIKYKDIINNINSVLDTKYLKQLIDNNVFDNETIKNIFGFIVEKLKEFQAQSEDNELNTWINKLEEEYLSKLTEKKISNVLPQVLGGILNKLDILEKVVNTYRQKLNESD